MRSNKTCYVKGYKRLQRKIMQNEMAVSLFVYSYLGMRPSELLGLTNNGFKKYYTKQPVVGALPNNK